MSDNFTFTGGPTSDKLEVRGPGGNAILVNAVHIGDIRQNEIMTAVIEVDMVNLDLEVMPEQVMIFTQWRKETINELVEFLKEHDAPDHLLAECRRMRQVYRHGEQRRRAVGPI